MSTRIKRSRPDMKKRGLSKKAKKSKNISNVSHFQSTVSRNKDFFNYINARDCAVRDMHIQAQLTNITQFKLLMYVTGMDGSIITYPFEYKVNEVNIFLNDALGLVAGDRLRFDIQDIDSVYADISNLGIGFILDYEGV